MSITLSHQSCFIFLFEGLFINLIQDGILKVTAEEKSRGSWNRILVTNIFNSLIPAEKERMIADAERYRLDDLEHRERAAARNELELYCYNAKSSIERVDQSLKGGILELIQQTIQWLKNGPLISVEQIESKKKTIHQHILNMARIFSPDHQFELVEEVMLTNIIPLPVDS